MINPSFRLGNSFMPGRNTSQSALTSEFSLKPGDFVSKPPLEDLFALGGIQGGDRSVLRIQRNMVTRYIFGFAGLGNVLHESAFSARITAKRIAEIQAG